MTPRARSSRRKLRELRDSHLGETAVIVCNGPSLLSVDLSLLRGVFAIGLNKINLLFNKRDFRPSCIVAVNPFVIEQNTEFYTQTDLPLFLDSRSSRVLGSKPNVVYLHSTGKPGFARDVSGSVFQGGTVTYVAMQLAFHLGFHRVGLIGCDHNFTTKGPANKVVVAGDRDDNHFDSNYFAGGVRWQLPDLAESEIAYIRAREAFSAAGRTLMNCTEGGRLEIFERQILADFLKDESPTSRDYDLSLKM
jgi:hypothetical protein